MKKIYLIFFFFISAQGFGQSTFVHRMPFYVFNITTTHDGGYAVSSDVDLPNYYAGSITKIDSIGNVLSDNAYCSAYIDAGALYLCIS